MFEARERTACGLAAGSPSGRGQGCGGQVIAGRQLPSIHGGTSMAVARRAQRGTVTGAWL